MRLVLSRQRVEALRSLRACADIMLDAGDYTPSEERNLQRGIDLIDLILASRIVRRAK